MTTPSHRFAVCFVCLSLSAALTAGCAKTNESCESLAIANGDKSSARAARVYLPNEADFRREYERDAANKDRQSWDGYWRYVRSFYDGNIFVTGWTSHVKSLLDMIRSEKVRAELLSALNDLGRRIAAEWAKDNAVRAINTSDLRNFGRRLLAARSREDGSGEAIRSEIDVVRAEVDARLSRQSRS